MFLSSLPPALLFFVASAASFPKDLTPLSTVGLAGEFGSLDLEEGTPHGSAQILGGLKCPSPSAWSFLRVGWHPCADGGGWVHRCHQEAHSRM